MHLERSFPLLFSLMLAAAPLADARHHYRSRLPNGSRVPCPSPGVSDCDQLCGGVGHVSCAGGSASPHLNAFGKDFLAAGIRWTKALCEKDSDGDGFTNGQELGDPCCVWSEGVDMPAWMMDWPISHPGEFESTQLPDWDEDLCKGMKGLGGARFYNEGEERITWEFRIKEHTLPAKDTQYYDVRFNFPDDESYYLVGADALVDNTDAVHHYLLTTCSSRVSTESEGVPFGASEGMDAECPATIWGWGPGGRYNMPLTASFPIGRNSSIVGINIEIHYDNVNLIEGRTDSSGVRFYLTKTPRKYETGNFFTGGGVSVGTIYPQSVVYSSTIVQVKLNNEIAPEGITIFGFTPHMHALGRKMWVEKLRKPSDASDILTDLTKLEKIEDIGRDDTWRIDDQGTQGVEWVQINDGDFIATTCIFNSEIRNTTTIGGISSQAEMCIGFLSYYPANGADSLITHSGPKYFHEIDPKMYSSLNSFVDLLVLPETDSHLPKWREAYLTGQLQCHEEKPTYELNTYQRVLGLYLDEARQGQIIDACGTAFGEAFFGVVDTAEPPTCSEECARVTYNLLGCSLLWQAQDDKGDTIEMYPSVLEAHLNDWCAQEFAAVYEEDKSLTEGDA